MAIPVTAVCAAAAAIRSPDIMFMLPRHRCSSPLDTGRGIALALKKAGVTTEALPWPWPVWPPGVVWVDAWQSIVV